MVRLANRLRITSYNVCYTKLLRYKFQHKKDASSGRANKSSFGSRLTPLEKILISDIDNTLVGDKARLTDLLDLLDKNKDRIGWGVATGRSLEMTLDIMTEQNIPIPDILICSVGTSYNFV